MMRWALWSALFEVSILASGCGGSTTDDRPQDSGVDATIDDTATDAPITDAPEGGPRVRMMIDVPFLEGSPVDNRFLDPQLTMEAAGTWFEYDPTSTTGVVHVEKRVLPRAPAGQATLYVPGRPDNPHGVSVVGPVKLAPGTHEGSIWIGTTGTATASVSILALDPSSPGTGRAFDFAVDAASTRDLDAIHWTQHTISMPRGSLGWGFVLVSIHGTGGTYLHAPVLRSTGGTSPRLVGLTPRAPTTLELSLARRAFADGSKLPARPALGGIPFR